MTMTAEERAYVAEIAKEIIRAAEVRAHNAAIEMAAEALTGSMYGGLVGEVLVSMGEAIRIRLKLPEEEA